MTSYYADGHSIAILTGSTVSDYFSHDIPRDVASGDNLFNSVSTPVHSYVLHIEPAYIASMDNVILCVAPFTNLVVIAGGEQLTLRLPV